MGNVYTQQNGYVLWEVISALQKEIRRGNEKEAMFWALELLPRYEAYLWRRLVVIANEDIGIANPEALMLVPSQRAVFFEFRNAGKDSSCRLVLANTIILLCRSPKSRIADHFQCVVNQGRAHGERLEIPDYALDKHTSAGKRLGRKADHWLDVGCVLIPEPEVDDPYEEQACAYWTGDFIEVPAWPKPSQSAASRSDAEHAQGSFDF